MQRKAFQDITLSRFGLGNMRLPAPEGKIPGSGSPIDFEAAFKIIDSAYAKGINYFDTAYVYNKGKSEKCVGECMQKYPRDSFYVATKYYFGANPDAKNALNVQLERLQLDYIDFYLIHSVMDGNIEKYLSGGYIEFFQKMKQEGKIRYLGFSSHASPAVLERMADSHTWDFAQLQINYFDWYFGTAKEEYDILYKRNIPIMVMEPVRGGRLAQLTPEAEAILKEARPDWTVPQWALRFVKSLPGVQVILSGMNTEQQLVDNCSVFEDDEVLTEADHAALKRAAVLFRSQLVIPCTGCSYCTDDCPMHINIPAMMNVYNAYKTDGEEGLEKMDNVQSEGKPADCIACGSCTSHCPQSIDIPAIMSELAKLTAKK